MGCLSGLKGCIMIILMTRKSEDNDGGNHIGDVDVTDDGDDDDDNDGDDDNYDHDEDDVLTLW